MTDKIIEKRFDKIDAQLERISVALINGFEHTNKILETKADAIDLHKALNLLDAFAKRQEISDDERLVLSHQLTRLHDWVEEAAKRIDLKFVH